MDLVQFTDVAAEVGLAFRHSAFQWDTTGDPFAMHGGGVCWIDVDGDGWLDLFAVNSWSDGEWGRWYDQGAIPTSRLYRNEAGTFTDVTEDFGADVETRASGCVAADLDLDGHTDLYVTSERQNVLLWNVDGERFETDDGTAGTSVSRWHSGAAVGDVNGDGWPDLFVAGYADLNAPIPEATRGFPNPFKAVPDLLLLNQGPADGQRPVFVDVAAEVGIESAGPEYGLGVVLTDFDDDGKLDLYVANDTQPNRLYLNETEIGDELPRFVEVGEHAGVDDDNAGMGVAAADYSGDGLPDLAVTNLGQQGHVVYRSLPEQPPPTYLLALDEMGLPDLGTGRTGWGVAWADIDLDGDLDLLIAHGSIPVQDLESDKEQLQAFENLTAQGQPGVFREVTSAVGLIEAGLHLGRGLAAADYDNDGDVDFALGTIGGDLALLRNTGAGGHWLVVEPDPALPGTLVAVTSTDGTSVLRQVHAGSSYISSEDPRTHFGLGESAVVESVVVTWPDGRQTTVETPEADQLLRVER